MLQQFRNYLNAELNPITGLHPLFMLSGPKSAMLKLIHKLKHTHSAQSWLSFKSLRNRYRPSPRPRGSARRKTASSLILRGHF